MGPFETMHLNVDGIEDYFRRYGANILNICESQSPSVKVRVHPDLSVDQHWMSLKKQWRERYLNTRRKWRDSRLAALAINSKDVA